jgi:8-oxo-dGTP pyrophosphatase MutT (NUDIX family)
MFYLEAPDDFNAQFEAAGCFIEHEKEILLLRRLKGDRHKNTWGLPSGKIERGESPLLAMIREIQEETGIVVDESDLELIVPSPVFVRFLDYDFLYYMYRVEFGKRPCVRLSSREHGGYRWVSPYGALSLPLITDLDNCIKWVYEER